MKIVFPLLFACLGFFTSCSNTYVRLMELKTDNKAIDSNTFVFDNDTMTIVYNFYGEGPGIGVSIYNKLNLPLYVDWSRSSVIVGTNIFSYWRPGYERYEEKSGFIPPRTTISKGGSFNLSTNMRVVPMQRQHYIKMKFGNYDSIKIKEASFSKVNSPGVFRNYLTFSVDSKFEHEFHLDHEFWISDMKDMKEMYFEGVAPADYGNVENTYPFKKPNRFFIKYDPQDGL